MNELIYGLITGIAFGFLLQRGGVLKYEKQISALRLFDMTIIKFMLSSVIVAMIGIYILKDLGIVKLSIKSFNVGGVITGGLLFGLGWGLLGYCPGTSIGAIGEGRWDGLWGVVGMLLGAALYAEMFPLMKETALKWKDFGKITLPQILGANHWFVIPVFVIMTIGLFWILEKKKL